MRYPLVILVAAMAVSACSTVSSHRAVANEGSSPTPTPAVDTTRGYSNAPQPAATAPAPGLTPPPPGVPPPTPPPGSANTDEASDSGAFGRRPVKGTEQKGPAPQLPFRSLPDGSRAASTINKDGLPVEIRIFKTGLPFTRIESTWLDGSKRIVKFTLKSGKVVELRTDKLASLSTATAAQLVELAKGAK